MPGLRSAERKTFILDVAHQLFAQKGYEATTIEDILALTGIAKGTLYYHFRNKEAILNAIIARTTEDIVARATRVVHSDALPVEKFLGVIHAAMVDEVDQALVEDFHKSDNLIFHVRSLVYTVHQLAPILAEVIEEGVAARVFHSEQPLEDSEILLTSGFILTDEGFFPGDLEQVQRRSLGVIHAAERLLGCAPGTLSAAVRT